jgi:hypothetical protein
VKDARKDAKGPRTQKRREEDVFRRLGEFRIPNFLCELCSFATLRAKNSLRS